MTLWTPRPRQTAATAAPRPLSIFDPVFLGLDEMGNPITLVLPERSVALGGEPGSGKSTALQLLVATAALCTDVRRMFFFDAKLVELGMWKGVATHFVGNQVDEGVDVLTALASEMDATYEELLSTRRRKIARGGGYTLVFVDELALYTSVYGTPAEQKSFSAKLRDIVARGRGAGIIPVVATQRPSSDIVPTSLRDLFGYRWAFRCTTDSSSDIILGEGWASKGHSAADISPSDATRGVSLLRGESGIPFRLKSAILSDEQIWSIAITAESLRRSCGLIAA